MERVYLDHNASSPLRPEARDAMMAAADCIGNPSSVHHEGRRARAIIETAREQVARCLDVSAADVIFTSGGTEAANAALAMPALQGEKPILLVGATEHPCVMRGHDFPPEQVITLAVDENGLIDLNQLVNYLQVLSTGESGPPLTVAVQAANNETGVIQAIAEIADHVHQAGGKLICDAVQWTGKVPDKATSLGADILLLSGHKFGGPKGVGAIVITNGHAPIEPLIRGGGQERGRRSGTENIAGIAGFAAALVAATDNISEFESNVRSLQSELEQGLQRVCPNAVIFGAGVSRLSNTTCFAVPGIAAETLMMAFDLDGIAVSSGSACSSGKVSASPVLQAMRVPAELASGAIRVSTGWTTTAADIERFLAVWAKIYGRLHGRAAA